MFSINCRHLPINAITALSRNLQIIQDLSEQFA